MGARAAFLAACAATLLIAGCGSQKPPLRVGVLYDCVGQYRAYGGAELSGAELPLILRGAARAGSTPGAGVRPVTVAGRPVHLLTGCTESGEFTTSIEQVRRMIELGHADVIIVGGPLMLDATAMRRVAARYPKTIFIAAMHGAREVTQHDPTPNVYRVASDAAEATAGLGTYAYRTLGWRRAAVALLAWDDWSNEAAFVNEFCALGGRVERLQVAAWDPSGKDVAQLPKGIDGVAVLSNPVFGPQGFLEKLAGRYRDPAKHVLLGPGISGDAGLLRSLGPRYDGVVASSYLPAAASAPAVRAYLRAYARAFPDQPRAPALSDFVTSYRNAMEATLLALQRTHGDAGAPLARSLAGLRASLLGVPTRMDPTRQAVVSASLVRLGAKATLAEVATIPGVDPSVGGLLRPADMPSDAGQKCRRRTPPPWALKG